MSGRRVAIWIGAALGAVGALGALLAARVFLRGVRVGVGAARSTLAAVTLRLYRRCPDCRRLHRADARVCHHCGYRRPPRGRRERRAAARHAAAA